MKPIYLRATLCYLMRHRDGKEEIWLALKLPTKSAVKLGLANKLNGYGGKFEDVDKDAEDCVIRETLKECGVAVPREALKLVAKITFYNGPNLIVDVDVFKAFVEDADPKPSEEMGEGAWYRTDEVPYDQTPDGDKIFLPKLLDGLLLKGWIAYSEGVDRKVVGSAFRSVSSLS